LAWATIALATVTFLLVAAATAAAFFAWRDLRETREATRSTYRPLLIDVSEHTSTPSDLDPDGDHVTLNFSKAYKKSDWNWRRVYVAVDRGRLYVAVPLRNVGNGPAMIVKDGIRISGQAVGREPVCADVHRERVPPDETTRVLCTHPIPPSAYPRDLRVAVPYEDLAGDGMGADVGLERVEGGTWRVSDIKPLNRVLLSPS
jgi:hypothetical protein